MTREIKGKHRKALAKLVRACKHAVRDHCLVASDPRLAQGYPLWTKRTKQVYLKRRRHNSRQQIAICLKYWGQIS